MLSGLNTYVRDTDLSPQVAAFYKPGTIFRSKNPADISPHIGGMSTSHRFLILSNHIIDLTELEQDADRGHCATPSESRFLVLDAYEYHGKTQITLLHLLDDERWRYFIDAVPAAPELEIDAIRINFSAICEQQPIGDLASEEWLDCCSDPIGVNPQGELYSPEPKPAEALWSVFYTNFRRFVGRVVYLTPGEDDDGSWLKVTQRDDIHAVLAYAYIDYEHGMSFRYLCPAKVENDRWVLSKADDTIVIIRAGALKKARWCPTDIDPAAFGEIAAEIDALYKPSSAVETLRKLETIDHLRESLFPDDIFAFLIGPQCKSLELVWLRLCDWQDGTIYGSLLNEPDNNWGIHRGDVLPIVFSVNNGSLVSAIFVDELEKR